MSDIAVEAENEFKLIKVEVGDVVTEVVYDSTVEVMIVVSNTVAGEVNDYLTKTNTLEVDGTEYKALLVQSRNKCHVLVTQAAKPLSCLLPRRDCF